MNILSCDKVDTLAVLHLNPLIPNYASSWRRQLPSAALTRRVFPSWHPKMKSLNGKTNMEEIRKLLAIDSDRYFFLLWN
jgi:hypothetical protein